MTATSFGDSARSKRPLGYRGRSDNLDACRAGRQSAAVGFRQIGEASPIPGEPPGAAIVAA